MILLPLPRAGGDCWAAIMAASRSASLSRFFRSAGQPARASNLGRVVGKRSITTRYPKPAEGGITSVSDTVTGWLRSITMRELPARNWP